MHEEDSPIMEEPKTQATFGGRYFDRHVFEFETDGGGGDGGQGGSGTAVVEPPASGVDDLEGLDPSLFGEDGQEGAGAGEEGAPPLSRDDMLAIMREGSGDAFRTFLAEAEAAEQQRIAAQQQRPQPTELPAWDPYNPDVVKAHMTAQFGPMFARVDQMLERALPVIDRVQHTEGEQAANSYLDSLKAGDPTKGIEAVGDFDNQRVIDRAALLFNRDGIDSAQALEQAARDEVAYVDHIEKAYLARLKARVEARDGLITEPAGGSGAAGEVTTLPRGPKGYRAQLDRSLANMGRGTGVGTPTG